MKSNIAPITGELSDVPVTRIEIDQLSEATEALGAVATVLRYVGIQGQAGGAEGECAASAAMGLASVVELAESQIEQFLSRQLQVRAGGK